MDGYTMTALILLWLLLVPGWLWWEKQKELEIANYIACQEAIREVHKEVREGRFVDCKGWQAREDAGIPHPCYLVDKKLPPEPLGEQRE